jgi:hypothetical protein
LYQDLLGRNWWLSLPGYRTSTLPKGRISGYNVLRGCITNMEIHCAWVRTGEERNYMESKDRDKKNSSMEGPMDSKAPVVEDKSEEGMLAHKMGATIDGARKERMGCPNAKTYMYPHDIDEVLKLCLSDRNPDGPMVKFAYKLTEQSEQEMVGST